MINLTAVLKPGVHTTETCRRGRVEPATAAPGAFRRQFRTAPYAVANAVALPICNPARRAVPWAISSTLRLQRIDVIGDVVGTLRRRSSDDRPFGARLCLRRSHHPPALVSSRTKGFSAVARTGTGSYCLTPSPALGRDYGALFRRSGMVSLSRKQHSRLSTVSALACPVGQIGVVTRDFDLATPSSYSNKVAFSSGFLTRQAHDWSRGGDARLRGPSTFQPSSPGARPFVNSASW